MMNGAQQKKENAGQRPPLLVRIRSYALTIGLLGALLTVFAHKAVGSPYSLFLQLDSSSLAEGSRYHDSLL